MTDPASDAPSFSVSGGRLDGRSITLDHSVEIVLGSGQNCHFRLELGNIDPDHAHVLWDERGVQISDVGSSTGTYVNGEKVGADHPLQDGDRIFLGPPGSKESAKLVVKVPATLAAGAPLVLEPAPTDAAAGSGEPLVLDIDSPGPPPVVPDAAPTPPAPHPPAPPSPPSPLAPPAAARHASHAPPPQTAGGPAPPGAPATQPAEARKPPKPEYTSDMPSMVPADRVREQLAVPPIAPMPAAKKTRAGKRGLPSLALPPIPRWVLIAAVTGAVTGGAFLAYRGAQKPPPVLNSVSPPKVEAGQTVSLSGVGFEADPSRNTVRVGDQKAEIISASETQITATIPPLKIAGGAADFPVVVESRRTKSNSLFLKVWAPPKITSLEPDVAMPGDAVVAKGTNLGGESTVVLVASQPATVVEASASAVRFKVPELAVALGKSVPVSIQVGAETGRPATLFLGRLPLLIEATPARGPAGERVTVRGRGFDPAAGAMTVSFGGTPALVLSTTATESIVIAPGLGTETQVPAQVSVSVQGKASTGECLFTVTRPAAAAYVPRYFAAPVLEHAGHDHVFVSTELGPALLLSGKADAPSTAERAERVAAALNALVEATVAGKTGGLELRDKPAPGVAVTGAAAPFVVATAADAAGYDEPWDPATKGRHSTPQEIAAFWAALLQDHLTLFLKFQRPFRVLELSPRGKVLGDIYAEATRRGAGGAGVPFGILSPLTPSLARSLRDLAVVLPAADTRTSRAAAAVEGHWVGTMVEGDSGGRSIDVRLRIDGGRLGGTLTARAGALTMDVPLKEAGYEKGTLRFVAVLSGSAKHFVGTLEGDAITGTIHASADAKDALGRFSLKYVQ